MITPLDIQNKEFGKGVRGYKEEEVDSFLDLITVDLEKLIKENSALKEEVKRLNQEVGKYQGSETTMVETLEAAKSLMREIAVSSEKRAEMLVKNAELDAQLITREAKETAERLTEESAALRHRFLEFKNNYKNLLESELARFDTLSNDIFGSFGDFVSKPVQKEEPVEPVKPRVDRGTRIISELERGMDDLKKTMVNFRLGDGAE